MWPSERYCDATAPTRRVLYPPQCPHLWPTTWKLHSVRWLQSLHSTVTCMFTKQVDEVVG